ncbi:Gfo/Idh/MocA family protein [Cohnella sp. JJ-181]|uniref:Gfo/Idh/MocA family protein n=1 Tax=Cohnella rhizoplanae TaxID=2974897 RepID=UPI0022FF94CB|nr:Gfo/Idh/MocA family oxidoreductase [Cohnella sp. JJ-181]CAI6081236.1 Myo-inositol 2-dehydrogenase [Cohnella sp. JJ-181]
MGKIKIGIVGTGSISNYHMKAYRNNADAEIYAVCDMNAQRAEAQAAAFGASQVYTDYAGMMADPQVDAVSICTWNNTHAPFAIQALEAGKHVLVEKPLCMTVQEALEVEKAVMKSGKQLQIGYVRRYDPNAAMLKGWITAGEVGSIYYAKASSIRRLGNPGGWFADKTRSGGGPLIDLGVHIIDLCWYLMGRPKVKSVSGNTYKKLGQRNHVQGLSFYKSADYDAESNTVEDMANALIRFENGASLMVDVSFTLHARRDESSVRLYGDKGGLEIDPEVLLISEKSNTIVTVTPQTDHASFDADQAFQNEIDHFIACCREDRSPLSPVQDGVEMMKILCGIYESAEQGREIVFD